MSEEEFLARWSRRKREARAEPAKPSEASPAPPAPLESEENEIDLSSLPSIEEIDAATDITAFLRRGIPQELSRAALRRAWTSDPAIRDFIGLAENAWDFNDPTAMPGFGPLDCTSEELAALVDRVVGGVREVVESLPDPHGEPANSPQELPQTAMASGENALEQCREPDPQNQPVAVQPAADPVGVAVPPLRQRRHGGALPH